MKSSTVDVLIVGAGPAGLAAAIELKKNGVKNAMQSPFVNTTY